MKGYYILDEDHQPRVVGLEVWCEWFENIDNRRVAETQVTDRILVSTVCLGIDHSFSAEVGAPLIFETMIFLDGDGGDCTRCATWEEAEAQHARFVQYCSVGLHASIEVEGEQE